MDPRLGLIVGTVTPTAAAAVPAQTVAPTQQVMPTVPTRQTRKRGRPSVPVVAPPPVVNQKQAKQTKVIEKFHYVFLLMLQNMNLNLTKNVIISSYRVSHDN